jgi:hypothetical protein
MRRPGGFVFARRLVRPFGVKLDAHRTFWRRRGFRVDITSNGLRQLAIFVHRVRNDVWGNFGHGFAAWHFTVSEFDRMLTKQIHIQLRRRVVEGRKFIKRL